MSGPNKIIKATRNKPQNRVKLTREVKELIRLAREIQKERAAAAAKTQ